MPLYDQPMPRAILRGTQLTLPDYWQQLLLFDSEVVGSLLITNKASQFEGGGGRRLQEARVEALDADELAAGCEGGGEGGSTRGKLRLQP